jgi:BlaI family penicillinase repressor
MPEPVKLGDRELDIMQALWELRQATVSDIHQRLVDSGHQVAYTTVQTMLNRLVGKGLVRHEKKGRAFLYQPVMKEPAAAKVAVRRVIDRFFGGDATALASHLVEGPISSRDLDRIQTLIDQRRQERKR